MSEQYSLQPNRFDSLPPTYLDTLAQQTLTAAKAVVVAPKAKPLAPPLEAAPVLEPAPNTNPELAGCAGGVAAGAANPTNPELLAGVAPNAGPADPVENAEGAADAELAPKAKADEPALPVCTAAPV